MLRPRVDTIARLAGPDKKAAPAYSSPEWRALIAAIIQHRGRRCEQCNRTNTRIFGDHRIELRDGGQIIADPEKWGDPANWPMVTPNMNRSITIDRLKQDFQAAKDTGPAEFQRWGTQHLNLQCGLSLRDDRWRGADLWEACGDASVTLDSILTRCDVVVCGVDPGGAYDAVGFSAIGREIGTKKWLHFGRAWIARAALDHQKEIAPKLLDLEAAGDLTIVDHLGDDVDELVSIIERIDRAGLLPAENAIGCDPISVGLILDALGARGINNDSAKRIVGVGQGWQLGGAIINLERRLADGSFVHGAQPLMNWMVSNARIEQRANSFLITKQASGTSKIDALMATFNATSLMALDPDGNRSVYEERNLLVLGGRGNRQEANGARQSNESWDDFERSFV